MSTKYITEVKVMEVEECFDRVYVRGLGEKSVFREESKGWFVHFSGSYEKLNFGSEKPDFSVGDTVKISFEKK